MYILYSFIGEIVSVAGLYITPDVDYLQYNAW